MFVDRYVVPGEDEAMCIRQMQEAAEKQKMKRKLLEEVRKKGYHFSDCLYCDALLDQYEVLRSGDGFFLAQDGNYSGAV